MLINDSQLQGENRVGLAMSIFYNNTKNKSEYFVRLKEKILQITFMF